MFQDLFASKSTGRAQVNQHGRVRANQQVRNVAKWVLCYPPPDRSVLRLVGFAVLFRSEVIQDLRREHQTVFLFNMTSSLEEWLTVPNKPGPLNAAEVFLEA